MHPAASLIAFTTLSGLGFGMLTFLGLGYPAPTGWTAFVFFALAYLLAVGGLTASTLHLGHPERALKAFTQWRSSWLSREAWLSVAALAVMALHAAPAVFFGVRLAPLGWLGAALCLATVAATSMIYASLRSIPRWHAWTTPAQFLLWSLAGGALLTGRISAAILLLVAAGAMQFYAWTSGDRRLSQSGTTAATATGLHHGTVRSFEAPHTGQNYLTREMVFVIARKHALKLRSVGLVLAVILPLVLLIVPGPVHVLAGGAVLAHIAGVLTIRWLFYAEAEHVVGLYYGRRIPSETA